MLSNSDLKYLRSLKLKKFRQKYSQFIVEGEKNIVELYTGKYNVLQILYQKEIASELEKFKCDFNQISSTQAAQITTYKNAPDVFAIVEIHKDLLPNYKINTICLDNLQDPGNLGTIIRTADWYGITQIICSPDCVDLYNPKTIAATMGSFNRVQVLYLELNSFLENFIGETIATVLEGKNLYEYKSKESFALLIGNEGKGIKDTLVQKCNTQLTIPKKGKAESLNAAIATGIFCDNLTR